MTTTTRFRCIWNRYSPCSNCNAAIYRGDVVEVVSASGPDAPLWPLVLCRACWAESEGERC